VAPGRCNAYENTSTTPQHRCVSSLELQDCARNICYGVKSLRYCDGTVHDVEQVVTYVVLRDICFDGAHYGPCLFSWLWYKNFVPQ
jgi:hypothetical protein